MGEPCGPFPDGGIELGAEKLLPLPPQPFIPITAPNATMAANNVDRIVRLYSASGSSPDGCLCRKNCSGYFDWIGLNFRGAILMSKALPMLCDC